MGNGSITLVIGFDGASWNVLEKLIKEKKLPNFKKLVENGTYGNLRSIIPPISIPAWKCYSTGKNPDKLNVYTFIKFDNKKNSYKVVTSRDFNTKEIWDYLTSYNIKSCVYKMFGTYPPKKILGYIISDFPNNYGFYPCTLRESIEKKFGALYYDINFTRDRDNTYFKVLKEHKKDFEVFKYLIQELKPGFAHISIAHTDGIQHFYWSDMKENNRKYGRFIENAWVIMDEYLGNFLAFIRKVFKDYQIFIISDHGFTSVDYRFNIGKWLIEKGYLKLNYKGKILGILFGFSSIELIYKLVELSISLGRKIFRRKDIHWGIQFDIGSKIYNKIIDFKNSYIIPLEGQLFYVNERKIHQDKIVKEELIKKIKEEIYKIRRPDGKKAIKKVYMKSDLYNENSDAPDIILLPNKVHLFSGIFLPKSWEKPSKNAWNGMHDLNGVFIAYGKGIKKNFKIENARIIDIAPTILHILGLPIPNDMDGRVLMEIFHPNSEFAKREPKYVDPDYYKKMPEKQRLKTKIKKLKSKKKL